MFLPTFSLPSGRLEDLWSLSIPFPRPVLAQEPSDTGYRLVNQGKSGYRDLPTYDTSQDYR